mgnify:CR=1 FL=1
MVKDGLSPWSEDERVEACVAQGQIGEKRGEGGLIPCKYRYPSAYFTDSKYMRRI